MKTVKFFVSSFLMLGLATSAQAEVTKNDIVEWTKDVWIPCADDGNGEWVQLETRMHHIVMHVVNPAGSYNRIYTSTEGYRPDDRE